MYKNNQKLTLVHDGNQLNNKSMPRGINQKRLPQIDGLRGIAALWVVLYHWTTRYHELFIHTDSFWLRLPDGRHGVHLFFMISGFVAWSAIDTRVVVLEQSAKVQELRDNQQDVLLVNQSQNINMTLTEIKRAVERLNDKFEAVRQ